MGKIPLASYILQRLYQHGVEHLHGVPGDFSLPFLSHIKHSPVKWIGNCNELNAGYAADGYARMKGLGALSTTYGVGELSAINAIAGCFAEKVPVINIVGTPSRSAREAWTAHRPNHRPIHHMLGTRHKFPTYQWMHKDITRSHVDLLTEEKATAYFDQAVKWCLVANEPVHVMLPSDMAEMQVDSADLEKSLHEHPEYDPEDLDKLLAIAIEAMKHSQRPLIMVDGLSERYALREKINNLVMKTGIPTVCLHQGAGLVDSHLPNYYGVYAGALGSPELKEYVDSSDFVLALCPLFSDIATAGWTAVPNLANTLTIQRTRSEYHGKLYKATASKFLDKLLGSPSFDDLAQKSYKPLPKQYAPASAALIPPVESPIKQDYLWPRLSSFFRPGDTILLANGTPLPGSKVFDLPPQVRVIASALWYSIGHMLPAAQGAALALQVRPRGPDWSGRTILLEGDGSFQATAQELSTIIRYKLDCTIIVANNEGYAYERLIEGLNDDYNDVAPWRYILAPEMMGGKSTPEYPIHVFEAGNVGEIEAILNNAEVQTGKGLTLVDVKMGRTDVPEYYRKALARTGERLRQ
jgi:pyruvate decarboxylase